MGWFWPPAGASIAGFKAGLLVPPLAAPRVGGATDALLAAAAVLLRHAGAAMLCGEDCRPRPPKQERGHWCSGLACTDQ